MCCATQIEIFSKQKELASSFLERSERGTFSYNRDSVDDSLRDFLEKMACKLMETDICTYYYLLF